MLFRSKINCHNVAKYRNATTIAIHYSEIQGFFMCVCGERSRINLGATYVTKLC